MLGPPKGSPPTDGAATGGATTGEGIGSAVAASPPIPPRLVAMGGAPGVLGEMVRPSRARRSFLGFLSSDIDCLSNLERTPRGRRTQEGI